MGLKQIIKSFVEKIAYLFPTKNIILFESIPDLSDNTKPVFDELVKRGYNKKYKMVWLCDNSPRDDYPVINNVKYLDCHRYKIIYWYYKYFAKVSVCCNRFICCDRKDQKSFYLMHGSPIKNTSGFYVCPDKIDYMFASSEYMKDKSAKAMKFDVSKTYGLGYPRNDAFSSAKIELAEYFGKFKKYVIWYPTVKQYTSGIDVGIKPIPFLDNENNIIKLNDIAKISNVLVIIKPHFAQKANFAKLDNLSNIVFIDDDFYRQNNLIPYEFVGSCDALLTDYSSVFYDFLLADKPIGFTWDDVDEFKNKMGFVDFYEETTVCGEKLYTISDLVQFISNLSKDIDKLKDERHKVCEMANYSYDGKNTERITEFIIDKAKLRL